MSKNQKAFTLIELLVTICVLGVLLSIAVPSFRSQIVNNRSAALGEDIVTAINVVRSEAVKRSTKVSLCASTDGATCSGVATDWVNGFIAVVDYAATDDAAAPLLTDTTHLTSTILQVWGKQDPNAVIGAVRGTTAISFIRYTSLGTLARLDNNSITVSSEIKKCNGSAARAVVISLTGMVSVTPRACASN